MKELWDLFRTFLQIVFAFTIAFIGLLYAMLATLSLIEQLVATKITSETIGDIIIQERARLALGDELATFKVKILENVRPEAYLEYGEEKPTATIVLRTQEYKSVVKHEMYHVYRMLKAGDLHWSSIDVFLMKAPISLAKFFIRLKYILLREREELLAVIYQFTNLDLSMGINDQKP